MDQAAVLLFPSRTQEARILDNLCTKPRVSPCVEVMRHAELHFVLNTLLYTGSDTLGHCRECRPCERVRVRHR